MKNNRLLELDSLRGIAALLVVLFHLTIHREQASYGFRFGVTGVDLFFIISGFVILMTLEKTKTWKDFAVSRFSRLYPAYWVSVILTVSFITIAKSVNAPGIREHFANNPAPGATDLLANLTMFQHYFGIRDIDGPYWTLIIEMLFYIVMTVVFVSGKLKNIEAIGTMLLLGVGIYAISMKDVFLTGYKLLRYGFPLVYYFPLFFSGILFYKLKFGKPSFRRYGALIICLLVQVLLFNNGVRSIGFVSQFEYAMVLLVYYGLFTLYVNNALSFIVNRLTTFLGGISYSLYLIHQFLSINLIVPLLTEKYHINFWIAAFLIDLPIVLGIATLINRLVEKPSMSWIRKAYKKYQSRHPWAVPLQKVPVEAPQVIVHDTLPV